MKVNVLVVDDEQAIVELVSYHLNKAGYQVFQASHGNQALDIVENNRIDFAIIDIMMPIMNGFELVREIKYFKDNLPILMLSAKSAAVDKLKGFELGVDDYLTKPFEPLELLARIQAILKRYQINQEQIIQIHDTVFDGQSATIKYHEEVYQLPLKQFQLAFLLASKPNQIFTREQIIETIWGMDYDGFDRTVDVHIKRIRENLAAIPDFKIVTMRGLGYKLEVTA